MRACLLAVIILVLPTQALAQPSLDRAARNSLKWENTHAADVISTWMVVGAVATPCLIDRQWQCVKNEALRVGVATGSAMLLKALVHRERPDGSENVSFPSQHTAIACAAVMRKGERTRPQTALMALCPSVAYERIAADKHWLSDTLAGGVIGGLTVHLSW